MRERVVVHKRARASRFLVGSLTASVFLLAAWIIAANTVLDPILHFVQTLGPVAKGEFADLPAGRATPAVADKPGPTEQQIASTPKQIAAAVTAPPPEPVAPAVTVVEKTSPAPVEAVEPAVPDPVESAPATETKRAEEVEESATPTPIPTGPVVVATAAPTIGGAEISLSSAVVAKALEPTAVDRLGAVVPLPRLRPRVAIIPLPRPRPHFAEDRPAVSDRPIADWEIARHTVY